MGLQPLQSMAAVEESSWGEVKSWQQTLPAAKIAHHDTTSESWDPEFDEIVGQWESRRFDENGAINVVRYVFDSNGKVTLTQTDDSGEASPPLHGNWDIPEPSIIHINWEGAQESTWVEVRLHRHEGQELLVLDYKDSIEKERRTLNQAASPPPPRNWLVELSPNPGDIVNIDKGTWIGFDFEVFAADGHLPDYLIIEVSDNLAEVNVLNKRAYTGSDGVPHVNLCFGTDSANLRRWGAGATRDLKIVLEGGSTGGFFVTGCGGSRTSRIRIFSPHANSTINLPLREFRVRVQ